MRKVSVDMRYLNSRLYGGQRSIQERLRSYLESNAVIVDFETTGLGRDAEIVSIGAINAVTGLVEYDSLVKPTKPIPQKVIHGITNEMVATAPTWLDIWPDVEGIITTRPLGIYNSSFDVRMLYQTCNLYNLTLHHSDINPFCLMRMSSAYLSPISNVTAGSKLKLGVVGKMLKVPRKGEAHTAISDAILTRDIMISMAGVQVEIVEPKDD